MKSYLLLTALVAVVLAQGGTDNCNQPKFNHCNTELGNFWAVDTSMIWKDLSYFRNVMSQLLKVPYTSYNYVNVCNGLSAFYSCLTPPNIYNCLGTLGFVGTGMSPYQAYSYEGFLADWRFKCGAGFYAVTKNPALSNCTQNTYVNYGTEMQQYFTSYGQNTANDPSGACTYAQNLMDGIAGVYANNPCRTVDSVTARWYGCQSMREWTNAQFRHCQHVTKCVTPPAN